MRMQLDASEVDHPRQARGIVDDDLLGGAPGREGERDRSQPLRPLVRRSLLIKGLGFGAIHEPLQHERPIPDSTHGARRDGEEVPDDVQLRELRLPGEVRLGRVSDLNVAPIQRQDLGGLRFRHSGRLRTWDAYSEMSFNTRRQFLIAAPIATLGFIEACKSEAQTSASGTPSTPGAPPAFGTSP